MKDGSMFGRLKKYVSPDFMKKIGILPSIPPAGTCTCMRQSPVWWYPWTAMFTTCPLKMRRHMEISLTSYDGDDMPQSVTLSTCAGIDKAYRLVVNAVRKQEGFSEEGLLTYFSK